MLVCLLKACALLVQSHVMVGIKQEETGPLITENSECGLRCSVTKNQNQSLELNSNQLCRFNHHLLWNREGRHGRHLPKVIHSQNQSTSYSKNR